MRILLGLSGGVDSATAALLLRDAGYEVEGAFMIMHSDRELDGARQTAEWLGIPFHVIDCRDSFESAVKANFVSEYLAGRTPNPCIVCNELVKMPCLLKYARSVGIERIATGHYASVTRLSGGAHTVSRALDKSKDQSYMLYRVTEDVLANLVLPLGGLTKAQVREIAVQRGVPSAKKSDSMEICFVESGNYTDYLEQRLGAFKEGDFLDTGGRIIGKHRGYMCYTVGQRKGLGVSLGARAFVTAIDVESNTVTLGLEQPRTSTVSLTSPIFKCGAEAQSLRGEAMLRYGARTVGATVELDANGDVTLALDSEAPFATPGQSAVVYDSEGRVLLGGFIR